MTQPGSVGSLIPSSGLNDTIVRPMRDLARRVAALEAYAVGRNGIVVNGPPGISVTGGAGIVVHDDGSIQSSDFDGTGPSDPGTTGWWLGGAGDGAVFAQAAFRDGIIGNDALTNPVVPAVAGDADSNIAITNTANTVLVSCSVIVPAGMTKAQLRCNLVVAGLNPGANPDNLWGRITIGAGNSGSFAMGVPAGLSTVHTSIYDIQLTGLTPGATITVNGEGWTTVATWPTSGANAAQLGVQALFLR